MLQFLYPMHCTPFQLEFPIVGELFDPPLTSRSSDLSLPPGCSYKGASLVRTKDSTVIYSNRRSEIIAVAFMAGVSCGDGTQYIYVLTADRNLTQVSFPPFKQPRVTKLYDQDVIYLSQEANQPLFYVTSGNRINYPKNTELTSPVQAVEFHRKTRYILTMDNWLYHADRMVYKMEEKRLTWFQRYSTDLFMYTTTDQHSYVIDNGYKYRIGTCGIPTLVKFGPQYIAITTEQQILISITRSTRQVTSFPYTLDAQQQIVIRDATNRLCVTRIIEAGALHCVSVK